MKIFARFLLVIITAMAALLPFTRTALAIDKPYWYTAVNEWSSADYWPEDPPDDTHTLTMEGEAEHTTTAHSTFHGRYNCDGVDCGHIKIYVHLEVTVVWDTDYPIPPADEQYFWYEWGSMGIESDNHEEVDCGLVGAKAGTCSMSVDFELEADQVSSVYDYELGEEAEANVWVVWMLQGVTALPVDELHTTITLIISDQPIEIEDTGCSGQYLLGAQVGTFLLSSQISSGTNLQLAAGNNYPKPGEWLAIQVTAGSWKDDGIGPDLRDMAIKYGGGVWFPLDVSPITGCYESDTDIAFVQVPGIQPLYLRVDDADLWNENTGTMTIVLYSIAHYSAFYSGCELQYTVGDFIETKTVAGDSSVGVRLEQTEINWVPRGGAGDIVPKRYYMLETFGGPVSLGGGGIESYTYDADLGVLDSQADTVPDAWYEIQTAPFVECVQPTDTVGHVRVYFALDEQEGLYDFIRYWYAFRVRDTGSYTDNTGSLSYNLYQATNQQMIIPGTPPEVDGCLQFSHSATVFSTTIIYGSDSDGSRLGVGNVDPGIYAISVEGGPWKDNGVNSYLVQISPDDGDNWYDLEDYPYLLCSQSADGDHYMIYVNSASGQVWRARVKDGDSNFTNNSLSINLVLYEGVSGIDPFPTCEENYTLSYVGDYIVPGNQENGKALPEITGDRLYSILVTDDSMWYDDGGATGSYLLEISDDGGETWTHLEGYSDECTEQIGNNGLFQIYFTAENGAYKLRVQDDADWLGNTGSVTIKLYSALDTGNPTPDPLPPEWVVSCYEVQDRPDSFIGWVDITMGEIEFSIPVPRVGEWLDYIRYAITYYFAWCPEHTEALQEIGRVYTDKEPLASILELRDFVNAIKSTIDGYAVMGGEDPALESQEPDLFSDLDTIGESQGGSYQASEPANILDLFVVGNVSTSSNPWFGGDLVLSATPVDLSGLDDYRALCESKFSSIFGITTDAYCFTMGAARYTKIVTYVLLAIDILIVLWWVLKYFPHWLSRFWEAITGEKKFFQNIASKA